MFDDLDRNHDSMLSLKEFTALSMAMGVPEEHSQPVVSRIDTDSNGVMSESELLAFFLLAFGCNDFDVMSDENQHKLDGVLKNLKTFAGLVVIP
jgi:Ca2+-binding EF-hand superfamily protein